jgi:hypothetical protein
MRGLFAVSVLGMTVHYFQVRKKFVIISFVMASFQQIAVGAISITNFSLSGGSVSFDIDGTFPGNVPPSNIESLFLYRPNFTPPLFVIHSPAFITYTRGFSGMQELESTSNTEASISRDPFSCLPIKFKNDFVAGESISGHFFETGSWIDTDLVITLELYWGSASTEAVNTGTLLTTISVPEPSSLSLLALGGVAVALGRRKK